MAKKPNLKTITSGYAATTALNENFEALRNALDNTVSRDGSLPNAMTADFDMNGNDIINAARILVNGQDYIALSLGHLTAAQAAQLAAEIAQAGAELAEANAEAAEDNAVAQATISTNAAASSSASAVNAALSETNAAADALAAQNAKVAAEAAQSFSEIAESNATTQAGIATAQAGIATTKAGEASASATAASGYATDAQTAANNAANIYDSFDDRYLGPKSADPTVDNDGNALITGALYFNTIDNVMKVYDGAAWLAAYASLSGALIAGNNLSDLVDVPTARTNLGLGTAATSNTGDFAAASHTHTLSEITDAGTAAAAAATDFATAAHTHSIEDLSDVASMTPTEGQALVYSSGSWTSADMSGGIAYVRKTANYTASANEGVIADTSGGAFTVTLPATPATGDTVMVVDGNDWSTTNLTVARNGSTIEGDAADLTCDVGAVAIQFTYDGTTWQMYTQAGSYGANLSDYVPLSGDSTISGTITATGFVGDGSSLTGIDAGAVGGGTDKIFWENDQTVTTNYTITNGQNAMSAGPITINSGVTVTVGAGETWTVV